MDTMPFCLSTDPDGAILPHVIIDPGPARGRRRRQRRELARTLIADEQIGRAERK